MNKYQKKGQTKQIYLSPDKSIGRQINQTQGKLLPQCKDTGLSPCSSEQGIQDHTRGTMHVFLADVFWWPEGHLLFPYLTQLSRQEESRHPRMITADWED